MRFLFMELSQDDFPLFTLLDQAATEEQAHIDCSKCPYLFEKLNDEHPRLNVDFDSDVLYGMLDGWEEMNAGRCFVSDKKSTSFNSTYEAMRRFVMGPASPPKPFNRTFSKSNKV